MTVETLFTVKEFIDETAGECRVYRYHHTLAKKDVFALFVRESDDDMVDAPYAENVLLLYDFGTFTAEGAEILLGQC